MLSVPIAEKLRLSKTTPPLAPVMIPWPAPVLSIEITSCELGVVKSKVVKPLTLTGSVMITADQTEMFTLVATDDLSRSAMATETVVVNQPQGAMIFRFDADTTRQPVAGPEGLTMIAVGARRGSYDPRGPF